MNQYKRHVETGTVDEVYVYSQNAVPKWMLCRPTQVTENEMNGALGHLCVHVG